MLLASPPALLGLQELPLYAAALRRLHNRLQQLQPAATATAVLWVQGHSTASTASTNQISKGQQWVLGHSRHHTFAQQRHVGSVMLTWQSSAAEGRRSVHQRSSRSPLRNHKHQQLEQELGRAHILLLDACSQPGCNLADIVAHLQYSTQPPNAVGRDPRFWSALASKLQQARFQPIALCTSATDLRALISLLQAAEVREPRLWFAIAQSVAQLVRSSGTHPRSGQVAAATWGQDPALEVQGERSATPQGSQVNGASPMQQNEAPSVNEQQQQATLQACAVQVLSALHSLQLHPPPGIAAPLVQASCSAEVARLGSDSHSAAPGALEVLHSNNAARGDFASEHHAPQVGLYCVRQVVCCFVQIRALQQPCAQQGG